MRYVHSALLSVLLVPHTFAQVAMDVLDPASLRGAYRHTWAAPSATGWTTPDMRQTANRVVGRLVLARDATAADSLCCAPIANAAAIAGKVALLYRGTCNYSEKARFCQLAGAAAVVVINNVPGDPVGMGAGLVGNQVTIPVFQVGQADGALLRTELDAGGSITVLLGNKNGYYADDIGFTRTGMLLPPATAVPRWLAGNAGEFSVKLGAWVHNFGSSPRTGVTLGAVVDQGGNALYTRTSNPVAIAPGDSSYVTLPDFSQPAYAGDYTVRYTAAFGGADAHAPDNESTTSFRVGDRFAMAPLDPATGLPISTISYRLATPTGEYLSCLHFRDPNAGRVAALGMDLFGFKNEPGTLDGEPIEVRIYEWRDPFTGLSDANFGFTNVVEVATAEYFFEVDTFRLGVYAPFNNPFPLTDNTRYLFCVATVNPDLFLGYNESIHYATNQQVYDQPHSPIKNGPTWFVGFTGFPVSSIAVRMAETATIGIEEIADRRMAAYPNPGSGLFMLSMEGFGAAEVIVTDVTGRAVRTERAGTDVFVLDLRGEAPGAYAVTLIGAKARASARLVLE